jgi:MFS family permease
MDIPAGKMAKRFGRLFLLVGTPALVVLSALGCTFTTDYWQLLIWRLMQGAGSACLGVAALVVLEETIRPLNRGLYLSLA